MSTVLLTIVFIFVYLDINSVTIYEFFLHIHYFSLVINVKRRRYYPFDYVGVRFRHPKGNTHLQYGCRQQRNSITVPEEITPRTVIVRGIKTKELWSIIFRVAGNIRAYRLLTAALAICAMTGLHGGYYN